jgi:hydrogenase/urease accessory protein HupE
MDIKPRIIKVLATMAGILVLVCATGVQAHEYKGMNTQVVVQPTFAHAVFQVVVQDAVLLSPTVDKNKDGRLSREEFNLGQTLLSLDIARSFHFSSDDTRLSATTTKIEVSSTEGLTDEPHEIKAIVQYDSPDGKPFGKVRIDANLFRDLTVSPITGKPIVAEQKNTVSIMDRGKRAVVQSDGKAVYETAQASRPMSSASSETVIAATMPSVSSAETAGPGGEQNVTSGMGTGTLLAYFLWQGVVHILLGWDHVFFVIGLLLLAPNLRSLLAVITAFTAAHSITLILASLGVINVTHPQVVEAVIAASVAFVGLENIIRKGKPTNWRWVLVFAFGLVHGLGFAGVLGELLGIEVITGSKTLLVGSLLTFNVGVEIGQLLILGILFPILQYLRRFSPVSAYRVVMAISAFILFMGVSFVIDRTVAPDRLPWVKPFNG